MPSTYFQLTGEESHRMEPSPWISALRHSHNSLRANVEPLGADRLRQGSYCSEWSIAQVLSHLGSGAEIFSLFLEAGLDRKSVV